MEIVLLGHMGRDEALAERLAGHRLHVLGEWQNPGLVEKAEASGGQFEVIDSIKNVGRVADFVAEKQPDMFVTNFDDALAAGVVDAIRMRVAEKGIREPLMPCPDQASARVEWDKFYLREIVDRIDPRYNPRSYKAKTPALAAGAVALFKLQGQEIVLKPRNLTGGKGVKVMGKHFKTHDEGKKYAFQVLASADQEGIEVQEKLEGREFTLQIFTDGTTVVEPPETYDYPYREDGDTGPGTGGMGAFTMPYGERLPFLTDEDYKEAMDLSKKLLVALKEDGHDFRGVFYPSFLKTRDGLKIVEVNARGGDPELINILDLMEDDIDIAQVLEQIAHGALDPASIRYKKAASAMIYLVSPDYSYRQGPQYGFRLEREVIDSLGCRVRFAAAEKGFTEDYYSTVGSSRTVGFSALGTTPWEARAMIRQAIEAGTETDFLDYRQDVADQAYIEGLK